MYKKIIILAFLIVVLVVFLSVFKNPSYKTDVIDIDNSMKDEWSSLPPYILQGNYSTHSYLNEGIEYIPEIDPKPATTTCSVFIVTGGDETNISRYKNMVNEGNAVNHLNEKGELVINIDPTELPLEQQEPLVKSTSTVSILVKNKFLDGRGANACESFISLVSLEK